MPVLAGVEQAGDEDGLVGHAVEADVAGLAKADRPCAESGRGKDGAVEWVLGQALESGREGCQHPVGCCGVLLSEETVQTVEV